MKHVLWITIPEAAWDTLAQWPELDHSGDPIEFVTRAQAIYAEVEFGDWLNENIEGGFEATYNAFATQDCMEIVFQFSSLRDMRSFQQAFKVDAVYLAHED